MLATFTKFVFEPVDVLYFVPSKPDGYRCLYDFGLLTKRLDNLIMAKSLMKRSHAIFFDIKISVPCINTALVAKFVVKSLDF